MNKLITFFSNFINEHQIPFCEAMYKLTDGNFRFVATEEFGKDRISLGFKDKTDEFSYVVKSYVNEENYNLALKLGEESDVVIIGSAPDLFIKKRLENNKLTFRYSERYFRNGKWRILDPRVFISHYKGDFKYRKKPLYMLCASAYTAPDCRFIFSYPNKTFRWGYFPPVKVYDNVDKLIEKKEPMSILWVSRFIKLKHPEQPVKIAKMLSDKGFDFKMNFIGQGFLEEKFKNKINKYGLEDRVKFLGNMSPEDVRKNMEKNQIFLFTSDKREGWGAVLNESMNNACAVVANSKIGSVPYLIEDGVNGFVYNGKIKDLYKKVVILLKDDKLRKSMSIKAYETFNKTWNGENAAKRLLTLIDSINKGKDTPFKNGPCSRC